MTVCGECGGIGGVHKSWCPGEPAPSPAAAGLPAEDVERVARAIERAWEDLPDLAVASECAPILAAVALAEMRPTAAEEAGIFSADLHVCRVCAGDALAGRELPAAPVSHDADGGERR